MRASLTLASRSLSAASASASRLTLTASSSTTAAALASPPRTVLQASSRSAAGSSPRAAVAAAAAFFSTSAPAHNTAEPSSSASSSTSEYKHILVSSPAPRVTLITLNRPKALNALNSELFSEINHAASTADADPQVGAIVITGSDKAFAAGADIKEMKEKEYADVYKNNFLGHWTLLTTVRKPIVAAVSGYALGGGCELAMMADIILASPTAVFGQPEINLGVIPGAGGTQRLTKALGKSRAMEIILTGANLPADEAAAAGLVSRVVKEGNVVDEAVKVAGKIASKGQLAVQAGKEAVNASFELSLAEGNRLERRLFQALFATKDQKEGMGAFAEKRKAKFTHE
ncbi:putative enoyl-CoA hydratase, mitochondrial [Tilletia horrida]|uniref:Probable enoyl-CoA hydratase, mitochondrial n=1 Tax=Tilletia horrida TaxID=155126 RepID=A0AAN6JST4_9BASI|nr:putative enoyl-CoA hydratase, mitochondrial [Tilletia horrida]KAK0565384.1 putative enoyl-CoA hydratase, mitochondrial [Tilletia horrida]